MDKTEIIKKLQECVAHETIALLALEKKYARNPMLELSNADKPFNERIKALGEAIEIVRAS